MTREEAFMQEAIALSKHGMETNQGGPFGCVIVKNGTIIGRGNNQVLSTNDPTAHAEMVAIRDACRNLQAFQLEGCEVYASGEPCPMCLGALYWAKPRIIYFGSHCEDAAAIGFDDQFIYEDFRLPAPLRRMPMVNIGREEALKVFTLWKNKEDKTPY